MKRVLRAVDLSDFSANVLKHAGDRVRYEVESGEPAIAIVARALAIQADTIVLGTRLRDGFSV